MREPLFCLRLLFFVLGVAGTVAYAQQYDLVLEGGRVIDPETRLDAVRNVGIRDGKIARVTTEALSGRRVIRAAASSSPPDSLTCTNMPRAWPASN